MNGIASALPLTITEAQFQHSERYQGDGTWLSFRNNERVCGFTRFGIKHDPHDYRYVYERPADCGGVTTGHYYCDGLTAAEAGHPFPVAAAVPGMPQPTEET